MQTWVPDLQLKKGVSAEKASSSEGDAESRREEILCQLYKRGVGYIIRGKNRKKTQSRCIDRGVSSGIPIGFGEKLRGAT